MRVALAGACMLFAASLGACGDDAPSAREGASARPVAVSDLPAPVRRQVKRLKRSIGARGPLRVSAWRARRRAALARLASDTILPTDNGPVYLVGLSGRLTYRRAQHPPGTTGTVSGRFAYATYDPRSGERLDFGVLRRDPFAAVASAKAHRVLTFNLKDLGSGPAPGKQIRRAARLIARAKPNLVGLQEVCVDDADRLKRRLRRAHGLRYREQPGSVEDFGCARGQAILSRNRILAWDNIVLGDLGDGEKRGYMWVETRLGGRRVRVYNTHLGLWSACVRRDVTRKLARRADRHRPMIFMGDFNASPGQTCGRKAVMGPFYNRFQEVDQLGAHETLPGAGKIDYVFTGGFKVRRARVFRTRATDHLPLLGVIAG